MPSDDYTSVARGPLKLKGAKVTKHKKKSKKDKEKTSSDVERALTTTTSGDDAAPDADTEKRLDPRDKREKRTSGEEEREKQEEEEDDTKTEAERRFAELKRKRVCVSDSRIPARVLILAQLKEMTESGRVRPELLKTHKERVEELNSHLSRLSEHHDMPKIGPG